MGYVTPDFGEHPTSHLMRSVWRLQRQAGRVRAVCLSRSPPDGSANRRHIASTCERWVELGGMDYREAAAAINGLHVQLLVDLNGHCGRHALLTVALPTMVIVLTVALLTTALLILTMAVLTLLPTAGRSSNCSRCAPHRCR